MSTTQLANIIDVGVFQDIPAVDTPEKTAFWQSGIVSASPLLNELANAPGKTAELPFWGDLDANSEPNLSSDNPADVAEPDHIEQKEQIARKAYLNNGWSAADLVNEIAAGENAMNRIRERIDTYWTRQWQRRLIATAQGVLADNIASNDSDMVFSPAATLMADINANTVFTRSNFTSAVYTLGDRVDGVGAIAVHAVVMKRMVDNGDIETIRDEDGNILLQSYLGKRIIVDDNMPYIPASGANAPQYISIIFGQGAFGHGEGSPTVPVEVARAAAQGNGGGIETLWTRKTWILHPFGYQNTGTPAAGSFSLAELKLASTWSRILDRKHVPLAFLVTNG